MTVNPVRANIAIMPERTGQPIRESQGYAHFLEADFWGVKDLLGNRVSYIS